MTLSSVFTHRLSKATLSQRVSTPTAVEMGAVHARTSNTRTQTSRRSDAMGGVVRHHLSVSVRGAGVLGERYS